MTVQIIAAVAKSVFRRMEDREDGVRRFEGKTGGHSIGAGATVWCYTIEMEGSLGGSVLPVTVCWLSALFQGCAETLADFGRKSSKKFATSRDRQVGTQWQIQPP